MADGLTAVPGVKVGVFTDAGAATGVTAILVEKGARAAVEVRGSAPGTRETDLLQPGSLVREINAVVLAGGSAYGLSAACGVVRYLEEAGHGFQVGPYRVPIVPAAVLFDLMIGDGSRRPDAEMGYQACLNATAGEIPEGSAGAGTGATVGKVRGMGYAVKCGQGTAAMVKGPLVVAALVVVNAFGDVYDKEGKLLAGPRHPETGAMGRTDRILLENDAPAGLNGNTTIGVVGTNACFDQAVLGRVCRLAHDGLARSIWPVHTMWDGDTIFSLSLGDIEADVTLVGLMAAEAVVVAAERAARLATTLCGIPAARDLHFHKNT